MPNFPALLSDGALAAGTATLLYTATISTAALTALLTRTPARRRAAQDVLKILLLRRDRQPPTKTRQTTPRSAEGSGPPKPRSHSRTDTAADTGGS
jgi:hypothetical protein